LDSNLVLAKKAARGTAAQSDLGRDSLVGLDRLRRKVVGAYL
jgi:hypothetical protein